MLTLPPLEQAKHESMPSMSLSLWFMAWITF
jgi:hypothetical protein